jgi:hypothetical protein
VWAISRGFTVKASDTGKKVSLSLYSIKCNAMKTYRGVKTYRVAEAKLHAFLTSAMDQSNH